MLSAPLPHRSLRADGPTAYFGVFNTVLRHDIGDKKQVGACQWASVRAWAACIAWCACRGTMLPAVLSRG